MCCIYLYTFEIGNHDNVIISNVERLFVGRASFFSLEGMLPFETVDTVVTMYFDIFRLNRVTEDYLCPPEANVYGIDFTRYKMIFFTLIAIVTINT